MSESGLSTLKQLEHFKSSEPQTDTTDSIDLSTLDDYENETNWLDDLLNRDLCQDDESGLNSDSQQSLIKLDKKLSKLLTILENAITDTSIIVDKSITEIETGVPRLNLDLQLMRENALLLRYSLETIQTQAQLAQNPTTEKSTTVLPSKFSVENPLSEDATDHILSRLQTLDLIKARMESSRVVLREAEAWSTLESEVTGYLTDPIPSHLKAAERLAEAAKSMVVFQHTPEYEGRRSLMRSLQNELEASLSTNLVKALSDKDVQRCKEFYEIFKMIEREGEFKNYYFGSRRSQISNLWQEAKLIALNSNIANSSTLSPLKSLPPSFSGFLKDEFYPALLKLLRVELDFLPHIFSNPVETLSAFLKTTIEHLQPSFACQLSDMLDSAHVLAGLPCLINCWSITEDFGWKVENLVTELEASLRIEQSTSSPIVVDTTPEPTNGQTRTRRGSLKRPVSYRRSNSRAGFDFLTSDGPPNIPVSQLFETIKEWEISLYEPFIDFQTSYSERELDYLSTSLINLNNQSFKSSGLTKSDDNALTAHANRIVPEVLASLFALGDEAINRCEALTHGYSIVGCLKSIDKTIAEYLNSVTSALVKERENREHRKQIGKVHQINSHESTHLHGSSYPSALEGEMSELEGLDYSAEDWEVFQHGLKLLSTCKSLFTKLKNFEKKSFDRVTEVLNRVIQNEHESLGLIDSSNFTKIKLSKGAKSLLKESTLNSKELWDLIEIVVPGARVDSSSDEHRKSSLSQVEISPSFPKHVTRSIPPTPNTYSFSSNAVKHKLYPLIDSAFTKLIKESQRVVQSIILSPLLQHVQDYAKLPIWAQSEYELQKAQAANSVSTIELKILDQFSKSPTELISKLGEGLFNLPRLFEIHTTVEEHALGFSISTLSYIEVQVIEEMSAEMTISTWLSSLTLNVLHTLLEDILPKLLNNVRLTSKAQSQLLIDLDYLNNVVKALDVDNSLLESFRDRMMILSNVS
ncbi:hypothetical protein CROQUDRAFT_660760 [Cronartium quercuum f. sp. fusiforme G11]|uniref:Conserved oligomeric Golgi complex subunit 7 n=1 Tax=Cronartium quercuum f. sp. fusiforme G11 TaxID=708437 RepID=A0A9P6NBV6_9BASI|nr:hypothetical protein CROQUDRAFT_660760 [Cronartium quercuum f. sp. fusiforme G11]